jgi:hypothetical protein
MFIDLLPIERHYRGVSRNLGIANLKVKNHFSKFFALYSKYLDWIAKQDYQFTSSALQLLTELKTEMTSRGIPCEIILYTDEPKNFCFGEEFLGFDVFGNTGESAIQKGNRFDEYYHQKLNENGLFVNYEDAKEFCDMWKQLIAEDLSPWETEENPRPFCIWLHAV